MRRAFFIVQSRSHQSGLRGEGHRRWFGRGANQAAQFSLPWSFGWLRGPERLKDAVMRDGDM